MNEKINADQGYVPYEIFKQTMELNTENMKQLYSMLHDLNMRKGFAIEVDLGGIKFSLEGDTTDKDIFDKLTNSIIDTILNRFYTKDEIKKIAKTIDSGDMNGKKGYC